MLPVPNPTEVARAVSHTTKAADEIYRLMAFAAGQPESRPDFGGRRCPRFTRMTAPAGEDRS